MGIPWLAWIVFLVGAAVIVATAVAAVLLRTEPRFEIGVTFIALAAALFSAIAETPIIAPFLRRRALKSARKHKKTRHHQHHQQQHHHHHDKRRRHESGSEATAEESVSEQATSASSGSSSSGSSTEDDDDAEQQQQGAETDTEGGNRLQWVDIGAFVVSPPSIGIMTQAWAAWLIYSLITDNAGLDAGDLLAMIASSVVAVLVLLTYAHAVASRRWLVTIIAVFCIGTLLFFPHPGANAFSADAWSVAIRACLYIGANILLGVLDVLTPRYYRQRRNTARRRPVRLRLGVDTIAHFLRCSWVLFVDARLLLVLFFQVIVAALQFASALLSFLRSSPASPMRMVTITADPPVSNQQQQQPSRRPAEQPNRLPYADIKRTTALQHQPLVSSLSSISAIQLFSSSGKTSSTPPLPTQHQQHHGTAEFNSSIPALGTGSSTTTMSGSGGSRLSGPSSIS
jgi:hypothetical protein